MTTERYWIDHCIGIARDAGNVDAAQDATKELEALRSALTDAQEIARRGDDIILGLEKKLDAVRSSLTTAQEHLAVESKAREGREALLRENESLRASLTARDRQAKEAVELLRKARRAAIKMGETKFEAWDAALAELLAIVGSDAVGMLLVYDAVEGDSDE